MKISTPTYLLILLMSVIHFQSSCIRNNLEPKPKELPPITMKGRNKVGFLLNGEVWLQSPNVLFGRSNKSFDLDTSYYDNFQFRLWTSYNDNKVETHLQSITFRIDLNGRNCNTGSFNIKEGNYSFFTDYNLHNCAAFDKLNESNVNILFCDLDKRIIAGTFDLEVENDCGDIYKITDGRFDVYFKVN